MSQRTALTRIRFVTYLLLLSVSTSRAVELGPETALCQAPGDQERLSIVPDGQGGSIVVWQDRRNGYDWDIYAQHMLASGARDPNWPADGVPICATSIDQLWPASAPDGAGGAFIVWHAGSNAASDVFAQHVTATGELDPSWPDTGLVVCGAPQGQGDTKVIQDGSDGAIVVWVDNRGLHSAIYAQHVLGDGIVDPAWPVNGRALAAGGSTQIGPALASDGNGGAIVTWIESPGILAQHVHSTGELDPSWPATGTAVCSATGSQSNVQIHPDGSGGAIIVWRDERAGAGNPDVYAQHVMAAGTMDVRWPQDGLGVCTSPGLQSWARAISDGDGGALITWLDQRSGVDEVFVQRILGSGVAPPAASNNGVRLSPAGVATWLPAIASDGSNGAVVVWSEDQEAGWRIVGQRLLASGIVDPVWPSSGITMSTAHSVFVHATATAVGTVAITWQDTRNDLGSWDVFGRRLSMPSGLAVEHGQHRDPTPVPVLVSVPNPSRDRTELQISLDRPRSATLTILDAAGRRLRTIFRGVAAGGTSRHTWDGRDERGHQCRPGLYFARLDHQKGASVLRLTRVN